MKRSASINDFLKPIREKPYQAYLSNALQVADVLDWVLQQLGKSEVWQTSFSISEEFIRRLYFIEKSGLVTRFNLVLDHKATNKTLKLWAFITQVISTTYLADNHSKVLLVKSERGEVVSSNLKNKPSRSVNLHQAARKNSRLVHFNNNGTFQHLLKRDAVY